MRSIIWLVLLCAVAVVAATTFGRNDGLVSLYWGGWRLDLSLNLFLALVFVLLLAAYLPGRIKAGSGSSMPIVASNTMLGLSGDFVRKSRPRFSTLPRKRP